MNRGLRPHDPVPASIFAAQSPEGGPLVLPRPRTRAQLVRDFLHDPGDGLTHVAAVLRARWQLRSCTFVGARVRVTGTVLISNRGRIVLHDRIQLRGTPWTSELVAWDGAELEVGAGTYINSGTSIGAVKSVRIGERCLISTRVIIMDSDFHVPGNPFVMPDPEPVVIEDLVWVGSGTIILKGVRIGRGASVGAGSVVTRDVAPGTVVAGSPARPIRSSARGTRADERSTEFLRGT